MWSYPPYEPVTELPKCRGLSWDFNQNTLLITTPREIYAVRSVRGTYATREGVCRKSCTFILSNT